MTADEAQPLPAFPRETVSGMRRQPADEQSYIKHRQVSLAMQEGKEKPSNVHTRKTAALSHPHVYVLANA